MPPPDPTRQVPAPGLREVAATRWDRDRDPVVAWNAAGTTFWLADPGDAPTDTPTDTPAHDRDDDPGVIVLARCHPAPADPAAVAAALAETVAACDFPPTDDHASRPRVRAALRAAGLGTVADTMQAPGQRS